MKVSFVIRTLNEGKTLEEVLRRISLLKDSFEKEVVIVDSGSTDNTLSIANSYNCKIVAISQKEWSWGKALNIGIKNSKGDYIVVISGHCFITRKDFLEKACLLLREDNIAAVYGKQLPVKHIDPFEEFELFKWYPDISKYVMGVHNKKLIGISNACCVLKKSVWKEVKFNEEVESLEDGIWAYEVISKKYSLIYSSTFGVYHSHFFNPEYIYRKWYWRNYEGLGFLKKYLNSSKQQLKDYLKRLVYKPFLWFRKLYEYKEMKEMLSVYDYIDKKHIHSFLKIKYTAIWNSYRDFINHRKQTYWTLNIPSDIIREQMKLVDLERHLDKGFSYLKDIE